MLYQKYKHMQGHYCIVLEFGSINGNFNLKNKNTLSDFAINKRTIVVITIPLIVAAIVPLFLNSDINE